MGFFKSIGKAVKKIGKGIAKGVKSVVKVAAPLISTAVNFIPVVGPLIAPIVGGLLAPKPQAPSSQTFAPPTPTPQPTMAAVSAGGAGMLAASVVPLIGLGLAAFFLMRK